MGRARALISSIAIATLLAACSSATAPSEAPSATAPSEAPSTATATPSAIATTTVAPTATSSVDPCAAILTAADLGAGFTASEVIDRTSTVPQTWKDRGLVSFRTIRFTSSAGGPSFSNSAACFNNPEGAHTSFDDSSKLTDACLTADLAPFDAQVIDLGTTVGDASSAQFCRATTGGPAGATRKSSQTVVYILVGTVVFSVAYNVPDIQSPPLGAVPQLVGLATTLVTRARG